MEFRNSPDQARDEVGENEENLAEHEPPRRHQNGADEEVLGDGDYIEDTQGALVLENLIGDFITTLGDS